LLIAIAVFVLWQIRQLLLLVFAAIVLAQFLHLQARAFQRLGMRQQWSRPVSLGVLLLFSFIFMLLFVPPLASQINQLLRVLPQGLTQLEIWLDQAGQNLPLVDLEEQVDLSELIESLQPLIMEILARPLMFVSVPLSVSLNLLIILVLAIMFWADPTSYRQTLIRLFPRFYRQRATEVLTRSEANLSDWLSSVIVQMATVAVLSGLGLWILGVRFALAQGILAGLLAFVPYLGPTISVIPPVLTSIERPGTVIAVLMLYALIHWVVLQYGLSRWCYRPTHLLPGVALLLEILFAQLFGVAGLILAFPIALVGQAWVEAVLVEDIFNHWRDRTEVIAANSVTKNAVTKNAVTKNAADAVTEDAVTHLEPNHPDLQLLANSRPADAADHSDDSDDPDDPDDPDSLSELHAADPNRHFHEAHILRPDDGFLPQEQADVTHDANGASDANAAAQDNAANPADNPGDTGATEAGDADDPNAETEAR
jgi:predicted PurR-regulated permease PerM